MKKVKLIKELPNAIPVLPIGTLLIVDKLGSTPGVIFATPYEDILERYPIFRRQYVLLPDEYEVIE